MSTRPGADHMQGVSRALPVARAPCRFAVHRDDLASRSLRDRLCPAAEALLKSLRRQTRDHVGDTIIGRHTVFKGREPTKPLQLLPTKVLDSLPAIGPTDQRT